MTAFYSSDSIRGPRGNRFDGTAIPDYNPQDQTMQYARQPHVQYYAPRPHDSFASSNYDYQSPEPSPLIAPRSQFAVPVEHYHPQRTAPPQRPPRPDHADQYAPSPQERRHQIYQQFFEDPLSNHHGTGQWNGAYTAPGAQSSTHLPQINEPASNLQALINQMRQRAPLGPPPSARRGPSSYYGDAPVVHPIVEETASWKGSLKHGSTRSINSADRHLPAPSSHYPSERNSAVHELPAIPDAAVLKTRNARMAESPRREDISPPNGHVRQASLGLKTRPTLTTVKSSDRIKGALSPSASQSDLPMRREFPVAGMGQQEKTITPARSQTDLSLSSQQSPALSRHNIYPQSPAQSTDMFGSMTDVSSDAEDLGKKSYLAAEPVRTKSRSPLVPKALRDEKIPEVAEVNLDRSESGALPRGESGFFKPSSRKLSERVGNKKPAHLNMGAVRAAEGRGSLTSLPDLITRATKLASNLDRGKTASRLGMTAWLGSAGLSEKQQHTGQTSATNYRRSAGSLSDMLASFPPPVLGTPPGSRKGTPPHYSQSMYSRYDDPKHPKHAHRRSLGTWSTNLRKSVKLPSDSDLGRHNQQGQNKRRRCCGVPLWLFILLAVLAICIVAAAIIVPIVLVVIPQQRQAEQQAAAPSLNTTITCAASMSCYNGGINIVSSDGSCRCLCTGTYTGSVCDQQSSDCAVLATIASNNASIGSSVPRIVKASTNNYSIPLDASKLVNLFAGADLTCTRENSLITFNQASKRDAVGEGLQLRQATTTTAPAAAATSNGIVFDGGQASTTSASSAAAPTSTGATSSQGTFTANSTTIDFARTAVLYVFQSSGQLSQALTAQQALQSFFSSSMTLQGASSVSLGNGASADLVEHTVQLAVGAPVGGGADST